MLVHQRVHESLQKCFIYIFTSWSRWNMEFLHMIYVYNPTAIYIVHWWWQSINSDLMIVWGVSKRHNWVTQPTHNRLLNGDLYNPLCIVVVFQPKNGEHQIIEKWWLMIAGDYRPEVCVIADYGPEWEIINKTCLVVWNHGILLLSIYWECHHPNWRTHIFQRGRSTTNQNQIKISHFGVFRSLAVNQNYWFPLWIWHILDEFWWL